MPLIKTLFLETRPRFLALSVLVALLGIAAARSFDTVLFFHAALCFIGILLLHISTNVLNDYYDHKSGVDLKTVRTPFNGGSGFINTGALTPPVTLVFGLSAFLLALPIGAYFVLTLSWGLLPLFAAGAVIALLGTSHITRLGWGIGELCAGLGLGTLPVFGIIWILTGSPESRFLFAAVPSGLLVFNLLFLNEFPDAVADGSGGRKTLVLQLGFLKARKLYIAVMLLFYLWIAVCTCLRVMPWFCLIVFLSLPMAQRALLYSREPDFKGKFLGAQAANVGLCLTGHFLLALGYLIADFY